MDARGTLADRIKGAGTVSEEVKPYDAKQAARDFMPEVVQQLQNEVSKGKGIARIQAAQTLMKIAEIEKLSDETAPPDVLFIELGADDDGNPIVLGNLTAAQS
jgi:protein-disulfide isomerase